MSTDSHTDKELGSALDLLTYVCHEASCKAGWWPESDRINPLIVPTKLGLIHTEISEAFEGYRKDRMDDHLPLRSSIEVELADALIRIFDLAGFLDLDLGSALIEKMEYNRTRADHKKEARDVEGGKKF